MAVLGDQLCLRTAQPVKEIQIVENWPEWTNPGEALPSSLCGSSASPRSIEGFWHLGL